MSFQQVQPVRTFLIWIVGNALGWTVTSALIVFLPHFFTPPGPFATLLILAGPIGLAQWVILRGIAKVSPLWILTVPVGWLVFYAILLAVPASLLVIGDDESLATLSLNFSILGAAMGLPQWLLLRSKVKAALLWILASALGLGLGFGLVLATNLLSQSEFAGYIAVSLVYGSATGLILSQTLKNPDRFSIMASNAT